MLKKVLIKNQKTNEIIANTYRKSNQIRITKITLGKCFVPFNRLRNSQLRFNYAPFKSIRYRILT